MPGEDITSTAIGDGNSETVSVSGGLQCDMLLSSIMSSLLSGLARVSLSPVASVGTKRRENIIRTNVTASVLLSQTTASGTSAASPLVAGLAAYLMALEGNPGGEALCERIKELSTAGILQDIPDGTGNRLAFNGSPYYFRPHRFYAI